MNVTVRIGSQSEELTCFLLRLLLLVHDRWPECIPSQQKCCEKVDIVSMYFSAQSPNPSIFFYTRISPEMRLQKKAHAPSFQRSEEKTNSSICCQSNSSSMALAAAMLQSPTRALSPMTRIIQTEMNTTMMVLTLSCHLLLNGQTLMSLFPVSERGY